METVGWRKLYISRMPPDLSFCSSVADSWLISCLLDEFCVHLMVRCRVGESSGISGGGGHLMAIYFHALPCDLHPLCLTRSLTLNT